MIEGRNTNVIVVEKGDAGKTSPSVNRDCEGRKSQQKAGQVQLDITQCAPSHMARSQDI
jgi:hypothetical protein